MGMTMKDCPVSRVPSPVSGRFRQGTRQARLAMLLVLVVSSCGGGNNAGIELPSVQSNQPFGAIGPSTPAVDLSGAPTDAHRVIGKLLPGEALQKTSIQFGQWDAERAILAPNDKATGLPTISAEYQSTGYKLVSDGPKPSAKQEYPQRCQLTVVAAPEALAAESIASKLRDVLLAKGFKEQTPYAIAVNTREKAEIVRFIRIDPFETRDDIYVAYVKVIGNNVVYAFEAESPPRQLGPDNKPIPRTLDDQRGTRMGAQLITLVYDRVNR